MKTHTHTDSPWKIEPFAFGQRIVGANGEEVAEIARSLNPDHKANARLISAAPEMLAALEGLLADKYLADPINADRMGKARAAVAKVKGGEA